MEDSLTRLWYSAFGHGANPQRVSPGLWALGNGYCAAGVVDLLEHLPTDHPQYVDVMCLLRRHIEALHDHLPVPAGWTQTLDDPDSFPCVAGAGLITYACAKAVLNGWVASTYWAAVIGGVGGMGGQIDDAGHARHASLPTGALDTAEAWEKHRLDGDPAALGAALSGCAYAAKCEAAGLSDHIVDKRPGAR